MRNLIAVSVIAAAVVPMTASANLVTQWQYLAASDWTQPIVFSAGNGTTSVSNDVISWGATGGTYNSPGSNNRSALEIGGMAAPAIADTNAILPSLTNSITHYNNVLSSSYATLTSAVLTTSLTLQPWAPALGPLFPPKVLNFNIRFKETMNTGSAGTCGFQSVGACDDIFVIDNPANLVTNFIFDGYKYTVKLIETTQSLTALSASACAIANAPANCIGFQTVEGQDTTAQFGFTIEGERITVPAPATLGLLALSVLGFSLTARRRKANLA